MNDLGDVMVRLILAGAVVVGLALGVGIYLLGYHFGHKTGVKRERDACMEIAGHMTCSGDSQWADGVNTACRQISGAIRFRDSMDEPWSAEDVRRGVRPLQGVRP